MEGADAVRGVSTSCGKLFQANARLFALISPLSEMTWEIKYLPQSHYYFLCIPW
jgi:hypothetical protein